MKRFLSVSIVVLGLASCEAPREQSSPQPVPLPQISGQAFPAPTGPAAPTPVKPATLPATITTPAPPAPSLTQQKKDDRVHNVCAVVFDLSKSFRSSRLTGPGMRPLQALKNLNRAFFLWGEQNDLIMIGQIGSTPKSILFEGSRAEIDKRFSGEDEFRRFLMQNSDDEGTRALRNFVDVIDALVRFHETHPRTRSSLIVLSGLQGDWTDADAQNPRLAELLQKYAKYDSTVALTWVDGNRLQIWSEFLKRCGFGGTKIVNECHGPEEITSDFFR